MKQKSQLIWLFSALTPASLILSSTVTVSGEEDIVLMISLSEITENNVVAIERALKRQGFDP
jgi:hypothetical protein